MAVLHLAVVTEMQLQKYSKSKFMEVLLLVYNIIDIHTKTLFTADCVIYL